MDYISYLGNIIDHTHTHTHTRTHTYMITTVVKMTLLLITAPIRQCIDHGTR